MIADIFIKRPVTAIVTSIVIVLVGLIALTTLPIAQYPDVTPPTVTISGVFTGADAQTVEQTTTTAIETQVNGTPGMSYMSSNSTSSGQSSINVVFDIGTDVNIAALDVQNRVSVAEPALPDVVKRLGLTVRKRQPSIMIALALYSPNGTHSAQFIGNYANIYLKDRIQRVKGVGDIVSRADDFGMRIWLNPEKLANLNMTPSDISAALAEQNLQIAAGTVGANPQPTQQAFEYSVLTNSRLNTKEEFEDIIVRSAPTEGSVVYLKDVARVELGKFDYNANAFVNGKPAAFVLIYQAPGANALDTYDGVMAALAEMKKTFPKDIDFVIPVETASVVRVSIEEVLHTFAEAMILVVIVVFLFLQNWRATLIPILAIPVSLIGTFIFFIPFGFTINTLTLFAFVLAIGIVVDDAIVVVEAVHAKMEGSNMTGKEATHSAMGEITGAVISITLVMSAVFIPIGFMTGSSGIFYKQFAYTLAIAIIISAVNALTLTPALCALLLKNNHVAGHAAQAEKTDFKKRFFIAFNSGFDNLTGKYIKGLKFLINRKWVGAGLVLIITVVAGWLMMSTPKSFVPMEDDGFIIFSLSMPPGTALNRTTAVTNRIDTILANNKAVLNSTSITGFNILSNNASPAYAVGFIKLKPKKERGKVQDIDDIMGSLTAQFAEIKEGSVMAFRSPPIEGYGVTSGSEIVLQDRAGKDPQALKKMSDKLIGQIMQQPGVQYAYTTFRTDYPQLELEVDEDKANQMGISVSALMSAVQTYFSGDQSMNFTRFGKFYRVNVKAEGVFRTDEDAFNEIFVRNDQNQMVPVKSLVTMHKVYGPESLSRYNLFNALTISVVGLPDASSGQIMETLEKNVLNTLPSDYGYEWTGLSLEEKSSGNQTVMILGLCLLFVYFLLAAQFESYLLPLSIILSIPTGILGAFAAIKAIGLDNNIYVQVGLIMLVGLLAKNAILIVEFAVQRRAAGLSIVESAIEGAKSRLRPIIMTSLAFIVGMIPLMIATGGSAMGNRSISTGAAIGMLSGVIFGVFVIPLLYILFQYLQEKVSVKKEEHIVNTNNH